MPLTADATTEILLAAVAALQHQARAANQRALVIAAGNPAWSRSLAEHLWSPVPAGQRLWLGENPDQPDQLPPQRAGQLLGQERQLVIVDAHEGFSPDAFAAISGTLVGGGLMLVRVPPLADWPGQTAANPYAGDDSRFIRHLIRHIQQDPAPLLIQEPDRLRPSAHPYPTSAPRQAVSPCRSRDQQETVAALLELANQPSPRPLVITADRGRGKSAALGIAAARLLQQRPGYRIGVCAPRPAACTALFERARALLPGATAARNQLAYHGGFLQFLAADALLAQQPSLDLLLIDEAAALPVAMLENLLRAYPRIAFASTVHGYEGTGRGFTLRFARVLDRLAPGWRSLQLAQPIRWEAGDPLEQFVFDALLMNAEPAEPGPAVTPADCRFVELDRDGLIDSPAYLRQLFGLLVLAHYRTRPEDLYRLLDAPDLRLFALEQAGQPLAVAVVGHEGGFDAATAEAIYRGRRRPRGHLLAQSLAFHAGVPDAARYQYGRILRIGVHPLLQRRGLGSVLLDNLIQALEREASLDAIGASFSAGAELLAFWQRAGLQPVRIGLTREHTSGQPSLLVLKPLNKAGQSVFERARQRLEQHWPALHEGALRDLDPALVRQLDLPVTSPVERELNSADQEDIDSFVNGERGYEVCAWPIEKLIARMRENPDIFERLEAVDQQLLMHKVVDKCDWPTLCRTFKLDGQKAARRQVRQAVRRAWQQWQEEP
ncbi:MAG: GNAT family N-acetyltransferase [Thiohalophilus sp.]|uniref:tRNA(Met) cytidine acetyltransferase TmcA n=1 Tax=Thiohalophilus sp. TaxID=3028392 RepID=UPI00286FD440|nr:GNAT family N-acetyltransferase [Thiohalophilus sp.]MDR9436203.1 GNAT family N-acetyltransferase [Thiohalophilus sp.]